MKAGCYPEGEIDRVQQLVNSHPIISELLSRWGAIDMPDTWLSGSLLAQARWNEAFGYDPMHGIADADLVYFEPQDRSESSEAETSTRISIVFRDLPVRIDAKNQARVHQWYQAKFGYEIVPYQSAKDAITTFPTTAASIGIRRFGNGLEIYAPFGLADLLKPVVRANTTQITEAIYNAKIKRWRKLWPDLDIRPWADAVVGDGRKAPVSHSPPDLS